LSAGVKHKKYYTGDLAALACKSAILRYPECAKSTSSPSVTNSADNVKSKLFSSKPLAAAARWLPLFLWIGVVVALFYQLGGAALFEPDEGRNAEKAREILVLDDWVTPHENFHPVLDKPIFFYWLIAIAYKLFGVSEWAARLPSALAALGCLALVYHFAVVRWGRWPALWSALILLTSVEFFLLARIVIFDMTLSFFLTLSLCAFYEAAHAEKAMRRRSSCLLMYLALGVATLIKGLVGVVVPGMVIFCYLLLTNQWALLRRIQLISGALLFLAIVLPWYFLAERENPGYLRYFFWTEHFGRFVTDEFDRREPWYYFIGVGLVGFLPWTLLLPFVGKFAWTTTWTKKFDDKTLFLLLWAVLPFLFFSVSKSKMPHYILPIFPPLAMLTALALIRRYEQASSHLRFALSLTWWVQIFVALFYLSGWFFPAVLPQQIRPAVGKMGYFVWIYAVVSGVILAYLSKRNLVGAPPSQHRLFILQGSSLCFFLVLVVKFMVLISPDRSAKPVAEAIPPPLASAPQVVMYDTYLAGLPFYLQSERPLWLITHGRKKRTFLGNYYAIGKRADPLTPWGKAILDFDEFEEIWKTTELPLRIIVKEKNLPRLIKEVGESPSRLAAIDEYLLVSKP
jgi:4-amino-4-deoxy-L-arabinose transferase-like glycosyltransferase